VLYFAIGVSTDDFAAVDSGHTRRLFDVVTELLIDFIDARWDHAITDCEGDTALVLTADVTVPVVRASAATLTSVDAVLGTTLGRHTVDVTAEREHSHILSEGTNIALFKFGTFNLGSGVVGHGLA
jgi:hypothetical protein